MEAIKATNGLGLVKVLGFKESKVPGAGGRQAGVGRAVAQGKGGESAPLG